MLSNVCLVCLRNKPQLKGDKKQAEEVLGTCGVGLLLRGAFLPGSSLAAAERPRRRGDRDLEGHPAAFHARRHGVHGLEPRGGGRGEAARHGIGSVDAVPLVMQAVSCHEDRRTVEEIRPSVEMKFSILAVREEPQVSTTGWPDGDGRERGRGHGAPHIFSIWIFLIKIR
jgi:hypothetical protein